MDPTAIRLSSATIVDGTGGPSFVADVLVRGGRLELRPPRSVPPEDLPTLDVTGKVVAPGFVDLHSHSGLRLLEEPDHPAKVSQGVTTEVIGVDGISYAPFNATADLRDMVEVNSGLDGRLSRRLLDWHSMIEYLDRFHDLGLNIVPLVGNTPLRINAVGWADQPADVRALDQMVDDLGSAMVDGAFAFSTGLDYPPGSYASTDELARLASTAVRYGGFYHTHVRYSLGDRFLDPFREAIDIGRIAGSSVHLTHFYHAKWMPGPEGELLSILDAAAHVGVDVSFDTYPSEWASTRLLIELPAWIHDGGPAALKAKLADRATRTRLAAELRDARSPLIDQDEQKRVRLGAFTDPANLELEGRTLDEIVLGRDGDVVDVICDLLLAERLGINEVMPGPHLPGLRRFLSHPKAMVGTDSIFLGNKPSPRTWGSYPRVLGQFARDEALFSLEEAVHKLTQGPAVRLGLRDRGVIREGAIADLVIFDPALVRAAATYNDPQARSVGIDHVIVGGRFVIRDGRPTGERPGRVLRRTQDGMAPN